MPLSGHLNPMAALARKLQSRGNDVVMIGVPDVEPVAQAANLAFVPFCEKEYPFGSTAELWTQVAKLHGLDVVKYSLEKFSPGIVAAAGIEALVLDTVYSFLELVPISLGIPYVQAWVVLNLDLSSSTPLCLFGLPHETTPEALTRNAEESAMGRPVPRTDRRAGSGTLC
jgi:UDP:flavonoid glycosyltransferase YjiC (YdhE family)